MANENLSYYERNKEKIKLKNKEYKERNKEEIKLKNKKYYDNNIDIIKLKIKKNQKKYQANEKYKTYQKNYQKNNKERLNSLKRIYDKNRRVIDPVYKLKKNIRTAIINSITKYGFKKLSKTEHILGCTFDEFKQHIESLWEPWMNWDNYGLYNGNEQYGWDIDHINPLAGATNEIGIIALNHYTNLQPLCSKVNRDIKRNLV